MDRNLRVIVCLLVCCFASTGRAQADPIRDQETRALDGDAKELQGLAYEIDVRLGATIMRNSGNPTEATKARVYMPIISHLIRSIESTRRSLIEDRLDQPENSVHLTWGEVSKAHKRAYEAVDMKLVELARAIDSSSSDNRLVAYKVEAILSKRLKQVTSEAQSKH